MDRPNENQPDETLKRGTAVHSRRTSARVPAETSPSPPPSADPTSAPSPPATVRESNTTFEPTLARTGRGRQSGRIEGVPRSGTSHRAKTTPHSPATATHRPQAPLTTTVAPSAPQSPVNIAVDGFFDVGVSGSRGASVTAANLPSGFARYEIGAELGRGGMGMVRTAVDPAFRRELAIKVLLDTHDAVSIAQFIEEAQITGQLEHPNIVPVHELGIDPRGRPFLAMKRIHGRTLEDRVRESADARRPWRLDEAELLAVFRKICEAMAYAHNRGVIHRDLKPENVMVGEFGEVLVMDWGLAKPVHASHAAPTEITRPAVISDRRTAAKDGIALTMQGEIFGTPNYMAPEQAKGDHRRIDERSDIFALGAILYALLACRAPYVADEVVKVLMAARAARCMPADRVAPWRNVPKELAAIAGKAMAPDPAARYRTAGEIVADIERYQAFEPIGARRDDPLRTIVKWVRRHPRISLAAGLSVMFAAVLGVVVASLLAQKDRADAAEKMAAIETVRANEQAKLVLAEQARAAAEAARRADAEQTALERQELLRQMRAGDYQYVLSQLEAQLRTHRDDALDEFKRLRQAAVAAGKSDDQFIAEMDESTLNDYIAAFDRLVEQHDQRGIEIFPEDFFYRALLRSTRNAADGRALADYNRAIALQPNHETAHVNRGLIKLNQGDTAGAMADFDRAIEINPRLWQAYTNRGIQHRMAGNFSRALADLSRVIELNPSSVDAYHHRALAYAALKDFSAAMRDFEQALKHNPRSAELYNSRGGIRNDDMRDHAGAIQDFDRAIELRPDFGVAYHNRGIAQSMLGNHAAALADFDRSIELAPHDSRLYDRRGLTKADMRDIDGAIRDYTRAIELDPTNATAYCNRGAVLNDDRRDHVGAVRDFTRAIDLRPDFFNAYRNRGIAREALGDLPAAIQDFTRALELNPQAAQIFLFRGHVHMTLGHRHEAIRDYTATIELAPQYWSAWANRGVIRTSNNIDRAEGIKDLQHAYRHCPDPAMRHQFAALIERHGGTVPE